MIKGNGNDFLNRMWGNRSRIANDGQMARNIYQHNGTGANLAVWPNLDWPQYLGIGANESTLSDVRVAPALIRHTPRAKCHTMKNGDVVFDDGGCANNSSHPVIDENAFADGYFGGNCNSSNFSGVLAN